MSDTNALVKLVPLNHIGCDERLQLRAKGIDEEFVDHLADVLADGRELDDGQLPVVFWDGHMYWMADGNHRIAAHKKAGRETMMCEVQQGGFREALRFALSANATHGLRRTNADKRRAVEVALADDEWRHLSDRLVAELCGVSYWLVSESRKNQSARNSSPDQETSGNIIAPSKEHSGDRVCHLEEAKVSPDSRSRIGKDGKSYRVLDSSRQAGDIKPRAPDRSPDDLSETDNAPEVRPPVDGLGQPLPETLIPIFAGLAWVEGVVAELGGLIERIEEHGRRPAGRCSNGGKALDHLKDARLLLRSAVPFRVCSHCGGSGVSGGDCPTCHGLGYLNPDTHARVA
jgi:hypothetical protein